MEFTITCPSCGLQGQVPMGFPESTVDCPRCSGPIFVPSTVPEPAPIADPGTAPLADQAAHSVAVSPPAPPPSSLPAPPPAFRAGSIDAFFSQGLDADHRPIRPRVDLNSLPEPLPESAPPADVQAEREWLREERDRLQDYMQRHFTMLRQQREELSGWRSQVEASLVTREQELNRVQKLIASRDAVLQERETLLSEQSARITAGEHQLQALQAAAEQARQFIIDQQALAEQYRGEVEQLRLLAAGVRTECAGLEEALKAQRALREAELEEWRRSRDELARRQLVIEKAETALTRRAAEMDDLEAQIVQELEQRHQELTGGPRPSEPDLEKEALRRKIAGLSHELEKLRAHGSLPANNLAAISPGPLAQQP